MSQAQDEQLTLWMREALSGNETSYRKLLEALAPLLRRITLRSLSRYGASREEAEDIVQDTLLAIHLKRHTWRPDTPLMPWLQAVARNKLIDALRRRGRHDAMPIEDAEPFLEAAPSEEAGSRRDVTVMLGRLKEPDHTIVRAIMLEEKQPRDLTAALGMSEGAIRVALHRALKRLSGIFKGEAS